MNQQLISFYAFLKENGIIWGPEPEPSIYSSLSGHYTYGPFGLMLKNKVIHFIRTYIESNDFIEIDSPLIFPNKVWENSGHMGRFKDPIIYTTKGKCFRLDKLLEEQFNIDCSKLSEKEILPYTYELDIRKVIEPEDDDSFVLESKLLYKNLMMETKSGSVDCGLRPETATATYLAFNNLYNYCKKILPIKVFQIGKAFRNEINPKQNIIRCREFTQAEGQIFINVDDMDDCKKYYEIKNDKLNIFENDSIQKICLEEYNIQNKTYIWLIWYAYNLFKKANIPEDKIRLRRHNDNEKAFYAIDAWDIEINLTNIGWTEICGIHDRGIYDLTQHTCCCDNVPNVLEIAIGVDRFIFSLLDIFYDKKELGTGKTMFKIPYNLSPIRASIFPLVGNKENIVGKSKEIYGFLKENFQVEYDKKGSIGKRYLRSAIKGIPYCITIDYQTLEDDTVTIRDRNTEFQFRLEIQQLKIYLLDN